MTRPLLVTRSWLESHAAEAALKASIAALGGKGCARIHQIRSPLMQLCSQNADIGDTSEPISGAANAKAAVVTIADMGSLRLRSMSRVSLEKVK
jgi:hypothetical protein